MIRRILILIFALTCFTTLVTIQQTHKYHVKYKSILSQLYGRLQSKDSSIRATQYAKSEIYQTTKTENAEDNIKKPTGFMLLPVLYYNMGPNNLFRLFKEEIPISMLMNRTLVVPPFHHHPRMHRDQEDQNFSKSSKTIDVDIFDQSYTSIMENNPNKVMNFDLLQRLLPVTNIQSYYSRCGKIVDTLLTCGLVVDKREIGLEHFKSFLGLTINRIYSIDRYRDSNTAKKFKANIKRAIEKTKNDQCVALALGSRCLVSRSEWFDQWKNIAKYFQRPQPIKVLANEFVEEIFHNESFLAIHWRYETLDWQDMCKTTRPNSVRKINQPVCNIADQIVTNSTFLTEVSIYIKKFALKKNLNWIYFAAPPQLTKTLEKLKSKVEGMKTISDVQKFAQKKKDIKFSKIFEDNFSSSFLEQELCYLSEYFLGSPLSSWTQTVMLDRVVENNYKHASLLDIIFKGDPTYPKLTWYFPEGL